jgi:hypothetical protein
MILCPRDDLTRAGDDRALVGHQDGNICLSGEIDDLLALASPAEWNVLESADNLYLVAQAGIVKSFRRHATRMLDHRRAGAVLLGWTGVEDHRPENLPRGGLRVNSPLKPRERISPDAAAAQAIAADGSRSVRHRAGCEVSPQARAPAAVSRLRGIHQRTPSASMTPAPWPSRSPHAGLGQRGVRTRAPGPAASNPQTARTPARAC